MLRSLSKLKLNLKNLWHRSEKPCPQHLAKTKRRRDRTVEFLQDEVKVIEIHKWIESEKAKRDLGTAAELDWIEKYAAIYREEWEMLHGKIIEEIEEEDGVCCSGCEGKRS